MLIEIINVPPGPAPKEFRKAWIGCILSVGAVFYLPPCGCAFLVKEIDNIKTAEECGLIGVESNELPAFVVPLIPAMQQLAAKSQDAVRWWEKRWRDQGRVVNEGDVFLFHKDACRIIDS